MNNLSHNLISKLENLVGTSHSIRQAVAQEALEYGSEDIRTFFYDLLTYGCQSGMITSLIYHVDTHKFYDTHYDEIEALRYDYEQSTGIPLKPDGDLKNWFAWFAFEETARTLACELGIEI